MNTFITVAPSLRPRDETATFTSSSLYPTAANGCVICPSNIGSCPTCPSGQECTQTTRTCNECAAFKCVDISSLRQLSGPPVGGIVGGVVGGMVALLAALILYYLFVYRKKHPRLDEDSDGFESKYEMESQVGGVSGDGEAAAYPATADESFSSQGEKQASTLPRMRPPRAAGTIKNQRLSSYESFMRPPKKGRRGGANRARGIQRPGINGVGASSTSDTSYSSGDVTLNKRHSVATTVSTTNASNILPIAYIPGVTIRPTKNNTRSIFLYDADSVFSDFTGLDNALIVQDRADSHTKNTMTAVKAQARLVNVARIDEDIAEEDEAEEEEYMPSQETLFWSKASFSSSAPQDRSTLDGDSDSDVDSDIGEIKRATSTRRAAPVHNVFDDAAGREHVEVFGGYTSPDETLGHELDLDDDDDDNDDDDKSFMLDIARET